MKKLTAIMLISVGLAGCSDGNGNASYPNSAQANAADSAQAPATCDMAEPGGDRQQASNGNVELIRQIVAWQAIMVEKARTCAESAGFTDLSRMVERPVGSHVMDASRRYSQRTEAVWAARGMRNGVPVEVFVTGGGVVSSAPSPPGATGVVTSLEPSRRPS